MAIGGVDVLLLDLVLPDIDGLRILGELSMRRDRTPVVMISGHGTKRTRGACPAGRLPSIAWTSPRPNSLQVVEIVRRVHTQHAASRSAAAPKPTRTSPFRVLLVEASVTVAKPIRDYLTRHAPNIGLEVAASATDFAEFLRDGAPADAVIVGPSPSGGKPLDIVRQLRSEVSRAAVLLLSARSDGETAVAAFKLGAQDYILQNQEYLPELLFSLGNLLRRGDIEQQNARLSRELEQLNRTLEAQVIARTAELQALSSSAS